MKDAPESSLTTRDDKAQLELFEEYCLGAQHVTRSLPLWDLLPIFLFGRRNELAPDTPISAAAPRQHQFTHRGEQISVEITPAQISSGKTTRMFFPGEREQLVSAAVRALAVRGSASMGTQQGAGAQGRSNAPKAILVTIGLTIRQLRAELSRTGHTFSHPEITDALNILSRTNISLTYTREGSNEPVSDSFPYYSRLMTQDDKRIIVLNPSESGQILSGAYRALQYDHLMQLDDPLARWLYQYLHNEHRGAKKPVAGETAPPFRISLSDLLNRGAIAPMKDTSRMVKRVRSSFELLLQSGTLESFREETQKTATRGRAKITDVTWLLVMSSKSVDFIIDANSEAKFRTPELAYLGKQARIARTEHVRDKLKKL
jgi:hypothetical protein